VRASDVDALVAAGATSSAARRLAVACAGHARGSASPMHMLPLEVLGAIIEVAIPHEGGCEVVVVV